MRGSSDKRATQNSLVLFTHGTSWFDANRSAADGYFQGIPQNLPGSKTIPHLLSSISPWKGKFGLIPPLCS